MKYETHDIGDVIDRLSDCDDSTELEKEMEELLSESEYQTKWTNHWDANPDKHGGCFVRWDGDVWDVIVTTPPDHFPTDVCEPNEHLMERFIVEPRDVWDFDELFEELQADRSEGENEPLELNPYAGFTDDARRFAESYSHGPSCSLELLFVKQFGMDIHSYYGGYHFGGQEEWITQSEYWEQLEYHGVETTRWR